MALGVNHWLPSALFLEVYVESSCNATLYFPAANDAGNLIFAFYPLWGKVSFLPFFLCFVVEFEEFFIYAGYWFFIPHKDYTCGLSFHFLHLVFCKVNILISVKPSLFVFPSMDLAFAIMS